MPSLNGMRAIAALAVVFYHWAPLLQSPGSLSALSPGPYAVIFFFVLSGFLITTLMLREQEKDGEVDLYSFWIRRGVRILPAFYVYLIIQAILIKQFPEDFVAAGIYISNYYQAWRGWSATIVGHTWSLSVEEQFYLLWPIAFVLLRNRRYLKTFLVGGILLVQFWRTVGNHFGVPFSYRYFAFEFRCDALMIGCLMAIWLHEKPEVPRWVLNKALGVVSAVLFPLLMLQLKNHFFSAILVDLFSYTIIAYASAILILQTIAYAPAFLNNRWINFLGATSYSIYIYHQMLLDLSRKLVGHLGTPVIVLVYVVGTVAAASLSYLLIEKPFLRLKSILQVRRNERDRRARKSVAIPQSSYQN